jgi:hypothetical protein
MYFIFIYHLINHNIKIKKIEPDGHIFDVMIGKDKSSQPIRK